MTLRAEKLLVSITLAAVLAPAFFRVSALTTARSMPPPGWLLTPLDRLLPAVPAAVWVYLSWYLAAFVVLLGDRATFRRAAGAYVLAFVACLAGYALLPISMERTVIPDAAGLSNAALRTLYRADPPVNLFPSFHAAVASILWRLRPMSRFASGAVSTWAVAVCLACVLTKQHYVLDVVAGLAVGGFAVAAVDAARSVIASSARLPPTVLQPAESETAE